MIKTTVGSTALMKTNINLGYRLGGYIYVCMYGRIRIVKPARKLLKPGAREMVTARRGTMFQSEAVKPVTSDGDAWEYGW